MVERLQFWIWHRMISYYMKEPFLRRIWNQRVKVVYAPMLKRKGMPGVLKVHKRSLNRLRAGLSKITVNDIANQPL